MKKAVYNHLMNLLPTECHSKDSQQFGNLNIHTPYPAWLTVAHNSHDSRQATVRAKILRGTYLINYSSLACLMTQDANYTATSQKTFNTFLLDCPSLYTA